MGGGEKSGVTRNSYTDNIIIIIIVITLHAWAKGIDKTLGKLQSVFFWGTAIYHCPIPFLFWVSVLSVLGLQIWNRF